MDNLKEKFFFKLALNESALSEYLTALIWNSDLLHAFYQEDSFIRTEAMSTVFLETLSQLDAFTRDIKLHPPRPVLQDSIIPVVVLDKATPILTIDKPLVVVTTERKFSNASEPKVTTATSKSVESSPTSEPKQEDTENNTTEFPIVATTSISAKRRKKTKIAAVEERTGNVAKPETTESESKKTAKSKTIRRTT